MTNKKFKEALRYIALDMNILSDLDKMSIEELETWLVVMEDEYNSNTPITSPTTEVQFEFMNYARRLLKEKQNETL